RNIMPGDMSRHIIIKPVKWRGGFLPFPEIRRRVLSIRNLHRQQRPGIRIAFGKTAWVARFGMLWLMTRNSIFFMSAPAMAHHGAVTYEALPVVTICF